MGQTQILRFAVLSGLLSLTGCSSSGSFAAPESNSTPLEATRPAPPSSPALPVPPIPAVQDKPLPINLATALQLANVRAVDVAAAAERVQWSATLLEQANVLWLPTITIGGDYERHDGIEQNNDGSVINNSRSSTMFGLGTGIGPAAILNVNDAIFAPLVARQQLKAREADRRTASNDTLVAVSDAYFNAQQARGELAGAIETIRRSEQLAQKTKKLEAWLVPELETIRVEAELIRRQQVSLLARERWKVASAELLRLIRLDSSAQVEPVEPPQLRVELLDLKQPVDDLIPVGLTHRPELASQQAQVRATLALLKQEKLRPLVPSILFRGYSTPVTGTLGAGLFAAGSNSSIGSAALREDFDLQVLWQLDNLGFGNLGRIHQRQSENRLATIELFRIQDRVAAEVSQAYAQAQLAGQRVELAEKGVRLAVDSADKNLIAVGQTRGAGNLNVLLVRPQEVVAAIQSLAQAYIDYYGAVGDYNRAQFRLYRALGQPAESLIQVEQISKLVTSVKPSANAIANNSVPSKRDGAAPPVAEQPGYVDRSLRGRNPSTSTAATSTPAIEGTVGRDISKWVEMPNEKEPRGVLPANYRDAPVAPNPLNDLKPASLPKAPANPMP